VNLFCRFAHAQDGKVYNAGSARQFDLLESTTIELPNYGVLTRSALFPGLAALECGAGLPSPSAGYLIPGSVTEMCAMKNEADLYEHIRFSLLRGQA
jgi:hypothetical protein